MLETGYNDGIQVLERLLLKMLSRQMQEDIQFVPGCQEVQLSIQGVKFAHPRM